MPTASMFRWVLFAAFAIGCVFSLENSPTFRTCTQHYQQQQSSNDKNRESQFISVAVFPERIACAWDFIEAKHDAVIASFTVLLGFATVFLWIATRDLVAGSESASRRQLRAYVSIDPTFLENYGTKDRIVFNCQVINHGQTPAFDIAYKFNSVLLPEVLPDGWEYSPPQRNVSSGSTSFPKREFSAWFIHETVLTKDEFDQLETGDHRLFVWGVMTYRDAFKIRRETLFNFSVGGPKFVRFMNGVRKGQKRIDEPEYMFVHGPDHGRAT